jgi:hypothetical protein
MLSKECMALGALDPARLSTVAEEVGRYPNAKTPIKRGPKQKGPRVNKLRSISRPRL